MQQKEILHHHRILTALTRKYPNQYIALVGDKVLAKGKDQFKVLDAARKKTKKKNETIGLFYLPGKKRTLYLLRYHAHSL